MTTNRVDSSQEYENDALEAHANKFAPRYDRKEPLGSSGLIDQLKRYDSTPFIGTEYDAINLVD